MNAEINTWKSVTVPLRHPVTVDGVLVTELTLREPDGEALEAIDEIGLAEGKNPTVKQMLAMIRAVSGVSKQVTDRMHKTDILAVGEALGPLLETDPEASGT